MPYYEVEITCRRTVCVKAAGKRVAAIVARGLEWEDAFETTSEVVGELDELRDAAEIQRFVDAPGRYTEAE